MPEIGEIRKNKYSQDQIWHACVDCGKERWVVLSLDKPTNIRCRRCSHKGIKQSWERRLRASIARKGRPKGSVQNGRIKCGSGYIRIKVSPDSIFYPMADDKGYALEHRIAYATYLGRCLQPWEIIHHKDGVKDNNELDNLELTTKGGHLMETKNSINAAYERGFKDGLKIKDDDLRKEIRLLRWQLKELIGEHKLLE